MIRTGRRSYGWPQTLAESGPVGVEPTPPTRKAGALPLSYTARSIVATRGGRTTQHGSRQPY